MRFTIRDSGRVTNVKVRETSLKNAAVEGCMVCPGTNLREAVTEIATHPRVKGTAPAPDESPEAMVFRAESLLQSLPVGVSPVVVR